MRLKAEIKRSKGNQTRLVIKSKDNNKTITHTENYKNKSHTKKVSRALGFNKPVDKTQKKKRA